MAGVFNFDFRGDSGSSAEVQNASPLIDKLRPAVLTGIELGKIQIKPRAKVLGEWFREADLGFIFAPRGVGKTWLAMAMATAIAKGQKVGPWEAVEARPV